MGYSLAKRIDENIESGVARGRAGTGDPAIDRADGAEPPARAKERARRNPRARA